MRKKSEYFLLSLLVLLTLITFPFITGVSKTTISPPDENSGGGEESNPTEAQSYRQTDGIHRHSFGIGLGQTFLMSDFSEHGDDSINPELYYVYGASYSFDFMANAHYSKHRLQTQWVLLQGIDFSIKGRFYQFDAFAPYFFGGAGFYWPKMKRPVDNRGDIESKTKTVLGVQFGIGADLTLNEHFTVGMIGHFHKPFGIKQELGPDVSGHYFKLLMMVMYSL